MANDKRIGIHFPTFECCQERRTNLELWQPCCDRKATNIGNTEDVRAGLRKEPGTLLAFLIWGIIQPRNCLPPSFWLPWLSLRHSVSVPNFFAYYGILSYKSLGVHRDKTDNASVSRQYLRILCPHEVN